MHHRTEHLDQTLVGLSFTDSFRATEFLTAAHGLAARKSLVLLDAVVVRKDADGKTQVVETTDPSPGRSAMSGAVWAGLFGLLLGGPVGWVAGAAVGAGAGAVTAKVVDTGVPDEWVAWFRNAVQPDTTTIVLLVAEWNRDDLVAETARFPGAELVYANVDLDTLGRIREALGMSDEVPAVAEDAPAVEPA
jgi:uncharacterized membrane protein